MTTGQLNHTLLDGELVIDQISETQRRLRLLLFDALVVDGDNVMQRPLSRRYGCLQCQILPAYLQCMKANADARMRAPFEIHVKPMDLAYGLAEVLQVKMPKLRHGCDGLIFTSLHAPYEMGTTTNILKWKPPQENTIDFKIQLKFPPDLKADPSANTPDWKAKPMFELLQHVHGDQHEFYDWLDMDDEEWDDWKEKGEQLDDRIVECAWHPPSPEDKQVATWHITRIRDDKTTANHKTTVTRVMESIRDGVMEEELIELVPEIRTAWKSEKREQQRSQMQRSQRRSFPPNVKGLGGPGPPMRKGGMPNLKRR